MKPRNSEKGIALLVALFAVILVSAIGLAMMFASNGETGVNGGFRQSNLAYFAARSGVEELRDRIRVPNAGNPSDPNGLGQLLPTVPIGQALGVLYVINNNIDNVAPWDPNNAYFDDELCHEIANVAAIPGSPGAPNKRCTNGKAGTLLQLPAAGPCPGATCWYQSTPAQNMPGGSPIAYKWSRVTLKLNESSNPWCVLMNNAAIGCPAQVAGPDAAADQVCYNGQNEFVLSDLKTPVDVPGRVEGETLPSQLAMAMYMYEGGSTSHGTGGHSGTAATSSSSTTGSSSSSTTGSSSSSTAGSSSSTAGSSSSSTTGSSSSSTAGSSSSSTAGSSSSSTAGSSSSSTGIAGTGSSSSSSTGIAGTGSSSSSTGSSSSSTAGSSSSSTGIAGTGTTGGSPAPSCGVGSPPLPGAPVGVGTTPVQAASCKAVESERVYMLTALAVAPGTTTRRMVQYEVAKVPVPPVPAALTIAGPLLPGNVTASNSSNYGIDGHDVAYDPVNQCGGQNKPAVGLVAAQNADATNSMNNFINAIPSGRINNYTGADGCSPDVQNVNNTSNQAFNTVSGLQGLVTSVQGAATNSYGTNPSSPNIGCYSCNPQQYSVTAVSGDLNLSGVSVDGYGILLVTGTLTLSGNFSYHGLILVVGQGQIVENGGGGGGITGAIVLAKIGDNSGCGVAGGHCYSTNPTDQNLLSQLGNPVYNYPGGGNAGFHYDSCMIRDITAKANFTVIARREITY